MKNIFLWLLEFFSWLVNFISNLFIFINIDTKGKSKTKNPIVIIIGGFTGSIIYIPFKKYLMSRGFEVFIPQFSQEVGNLATASYNLQKYMQKKEIFNATLVGISEGGLISYLYLEELNGWSRVNKFISIAAPFKGTWAAIFTYIRLTGRQLIPTSKYIEKIQSIKSKNVEKIYCIVAKKDELVPSWSSFIDGSEVIKTNVVGHVRVHCFSKNTFRIVADIAGQNSK